MLQSIDDVIAELDRILDELAEQSSPLGYFPALYQRVTIEVKKAIDNSQFDDADRMERLDIIFAQRYIDAYQSYRDSGTCTQSWQVAFQSGSNSSLTVLQHLLLGMNAHISLDLGIAAAAVSNSDPLSLKRDFYLINEILGSQIDDTQDRLSRVFRPLRFVDTLLGSIDEQLSLFSIGYARDKAWSQALELIVSALSQHKKLIEERDQSVAKFATHLIHPPKFRIRLILWLVRLLERGTIETRLKILRQDHSHSKR